MQKKETRNSGRLKTSEQEKARPKKGAGRKGYSERSGKETNQRRRRRKRGNAKRKRQNDIRRQAFNLADLLPEETIEGLIKFKGGLKSGKRKQNGRNNRRHIKRRRRKVEGFGEGRGTDASGR